MNKSNFLITVAHPDKNSDSDNIDTEYELRAELSKVLATFKNQGKISHFMLGDDEVINERLLVTKQIVSNLSHKCFIPKFPVATLIGSTRFKDEFDKLSRDLTLRGYMVLNLSVFTGADDSVELDSKQLKMLIEMIHQKIDVADVVYVVNVDGYIGSNTASEIEYAKSNGKEIKYLVEV